MLQMLTPTHPDQVLSAKENAALCEAIGGAAPALLLRSDTRVDTGRWLGKSAVWVCLTDSAIVLVAASKRRYVQRMSLSECEQTEYCHTSGALHLHPSDQWRFNTIALPPVDGLKVLEHIKSAANQTKPSPITEPTGA